MATPLTLAIAAAACAPGPGSTAGRALELDPAHDGRHAWRRPVEARRFHRPAPPPGCGLAVSCLVPRGGSARFRVIAAGRPATPLLDVQHAAPAHAARIVDHRIVLSPGERRPRLLFEVLPAAGLPARLGLPEPWREPPPGARFSEPSVVPPARGRSLDPRPDVVVVSESPGGSRVRGLAALLDDLGSRGYRTSVVDGIAEDVRDAPLARHAGRAVAPGRANVSLHAHRELVRFDGRGPFALVVVTSREGAALAASLEGRLRARGLLAHASVRRERGPPEGRVRTRAARGSGGSAGRR